MLSSWEASTIQRLPCPLQRSQCPSHPKFMPPDASQRPQAQQHRKLSGPKAEMVAFGPLAPNGPSAVSSRGLLPQGLSL